MGQDIHFATQRRQDEELRTGVPDCRLPPRVPISRRVLERAARALEALTRLDCAVLWVSGRRQQTKL